MPAGFSQQRYMFRAILLFKCSDILLYCLFSELGAAYLWKLYFALKLSFSHFQVTKTNKVSLRGSAASTELAKQQVQTI